MLHGNEMRTPNPDCPDCKTGHWHSAENRRLYHPLAGHGFVKELGWTYDKEKADA